MNSRKCIYKKQYKNINLAEICSKKIEQSEVNSQMLAIIIWWQDIGYELDQNNFSLSLNFSHQRSSL